MNPHNFSITESISEQEARLLLSGELDLVVAAEVRRVIARHARSEQRKVLDLRGISFIDSRGLAAVFRSVREAGIGQVTVVPSEHLQPRRYLEIAGMVNLGVALEQPQ